jgi:Domain of unknown function (DUF4349)
MNKLADTILARFRSPRFRLMQILAMAAFLIALALFLVSRTFKPGSQTERLVGTYEQLQKNTIAIPTPRTDSKLKLVTAALEQGRLSSELENNQPVPPPSPAGPVFHEGQPLIARTAEMELLVKNLADGRTAVETVINRHHGYLAELHVEGDNVGRNLVATVRVPAEEFAAALQEFKSVGQVEKESQSAEDVSQPYMDLSARLHNAQETETRLQEVLQHRTGKMSDILEVEQEISRVRGEIEGMQAELRGLNRRISFSSIALTVREQYSAQFAGATPSLNQFRNATVNGLREAWLSLLGIILFLMGYGPALLLWAAILFFPARFLFRKLRHANWGVAVSQKPAAQDAK